MRRHRDQIGSQCLCGKGDFQKTLYRVCVKNCFRTDFVSQLSHLLNGHNGANFVIDHHDGNKDRVFTQGGFQRIQFDASIAVWLQIGNLKALCLQILHCV